MAKDPAFLFYPGDWLGGTMGMTFEEKGAYLELLVMQWNCRRIAKDDAIRLVGNALWQKLAGKFFHDKDGFFNKKLEEVVIKRRQHSKKQSDNANKRWGKDLCDGNAMAMPLETETINEDKDEIDKGVVRGKKFLASEFNSLPEMKANMSKELLRITKGVDASDSDISGLWEVFKEQNLTGKKYYNSDDDVYSHFFNWLNTKKINGNSKTSKPGTSEARVNAIKKW